jgi:hypothetical protein
LQPLTLTILPHTLAVCRLAPDAPLPGWLAESEFWSATRSPEELSLVVEERLAPAEWQAERGWRCLKVQGPLDFGLTGVLAGLAVPLAEAGISIFAISTYDTDYILVRKGQLERAVILLSARGYRVKEGMD